MHKHHDYYNSIKRRFKALGLPLDGELGRLNELAKLTRNGLLQRHVEMRTDAAEAAHAHCPFHEPPPGSGVDAGSIGALETWSGNPVRLSFTPGCSSSVTHMATLGPTGTGKSSFLVELSEQAAHIYSTLIIDPVKAFRKSSAIRKSHDFIRISDMRLNLFDSPTGVSSSIVDQVVCREIARNYSLQYGMLEMMEAVAELRQNGTPNLSSLIETLSRKRYANFSRRSMYRDSALLILTHVKHGFGTVFECASGMSLDHLFDGNTVLEVDALLPEHIRFLLRFFFEHLQLRALRT